MADRQRQMHVSYTTHVPGRPDSAFIQPLGSWKLRPGCQTASMFAATNFNNSRPVESERRRRRHPGRQFPRPRSRERASGPRGRGRRRRGRRRGGSRADRGGAAHGRDRRRGGGGRVGGCISRVTARSRRALHDSGLIAPLGIADGCTRGENSAIIAPGHLRPKVVLLVGRREADRAQRPGSSVRVRGQDQLVRRRVEGPLHEIRIVRRRREARRRRRRGPPWVVIARV